MFASKVLALLATLHLAVAAPADTLLERRALKLPTTDAPYSVSTANLSAAIQCKSKLDGTKNAILLVHGTALTSKSWMSGPYWDLLPQQVPSYVPCTVNIPHNALADAQVNAEYVAYAIQTLSKKTKNKKIAVVGHSQGGGLNIPWASIFWPSARSKISSFIGLAPDFHGTILLPQAACVLETALSGGQGCSTSFIQQESTSHYLAAQEAFLTKAIVPTTAVFTRTDEIVEPQFPDAIASSRLPGSVQYPLQDLDVCGPLHIADHLSMQIDPAAYAIVLQAIQSPNGLPDKSKFDKSSCTNFANTDLNFQDAKPTLDYLQSLGTAVLFSEGIYSKTEPPLKSYVRRAGYTA